MRRESILRNLGNVREARKEWAKHQTNFNAAVDKVLRRLLHEAAAEKMSVREVADATGFSPSRVRNYMKRFNLDVKSGRTLLAHNAAIALRDNTELLGEEPDLMSMLAYLPAGSVLAQTVENERMAERQAETPLAEQIRPLLKRAYKDGQRDYSKGHSDPTSAADFIIKENNL